MTLDANTYRQLWNEFQSTGKPIAELVKEYEQKHAPKTSIIRKPNNSAPDNGKHHGHPETDLQRECVTWFRDGYPDIAPCLFHPNNEPFFGGSGKTDKQKKIQGHLAKTMGVTPGVADLIMLIPSYDGKYHGLCIEMKTKTGSQSDNQKEWQKAVEKHGYRYEIAKSLLAFKTIIREHLHREPNIKDNLANIF